MKLKALKDPEAWERRLLRMKKRLLGRFRRACKTKAVFVLGKQRSGTTMLMRVFHRHPDILVFDESVNNPAFINFRIRSADTVRGLLAQTRFPAVCLKPICDSHRIQELRGDFPDGDYVWMYRDFRDVANSSLRKFNAATRAIRLVCTGRSGGGWFQEGISPRVGMVLREVYHPGLSDFDLACLIWWARNQLIIESGLLGQPGVTLLKYEAVVSAPSVMLTWLFQRIGISYSDRVERRITARSIGRHSAPAMDPRIRDLCSSTLAELDQAFLEQHPPVTGIPRARSAFERSQAAAGAATNQ